ncbi:unnamed protein product, partial [Polarella glacialis]
VSTVVSMRHHARLPKLLPLYLWLLCALPVGIFAKLDLVDGLLKPKGLALDTSAGRIYWAEVGAMKIRSAKLDGTDIRDVLVKSDVLGAPTSLALDSIEKKIYWTARCCSVRRANLDGSDEQEVASAEYSSGIALDRVTRKVYWADWMQGRIMRADMSGSEAEVFYSKNLASPVDVALDPSHDMIYWSDFGRYRIERTGVDVATPVQGLNMSWAVMQTYGIAIDSLARKIYLSDYEHAGIEYTGRIIRTSLDGDDSEVLVSEPGMQMPTSMALDTDNGILYWTDQKSGKIQRLFLQCPASTLIVASRGNDTLEVQYAGSEHGSLTIAPCPEKYSGNLTLACSNGEVSVSSGRCGKRCPAGSVAPTFGLLKHEPDVEVNYGAMDDGERVDVPCPSDLVGVSQLKCKEGIVSVLGQNCRTAQPCKAGDTLVGDALVAYGFVPHGLMDGGACPSGFQGNFLFLCQDGQVVLTHNSSCRATCSAGSLWVDGGAVE